MGESASSNLKIENFRDYLRLLAQLQIPAKLKKKLDASDLVQMTLLKAHEADADFRGETRAERAAWLRQILAHTIANALRDHGRAKRDVALERSLEDALHSSSARLEAWLVDNGSSPSAASQRNEQVEELAQALARLPEIQRQALLMHYCEGLPLIAISEALNRTRPAVASLLRRGLKHMREFIKWMGNDLSSLPDTAMGLDEIIAAYLDAMDAGQAGERQEWLSRYPESAADAVAVASHPKSPKYCPHGLEPLNAGDRT